MIACYVWSGMCLEAEHQARRGNLRGAARFHQACRGRWFSRAGDHPKACPCPCHQIVEDDVRDVVAKARRERQLAAGIDLEGPTPAGTPRTQCGNKHDMTPENTNPSGDCRRCKREASARRRLNRRRAKQQAEGLDA